ncbi:MAG: T9SS type A sorting domain-containing protein [Candidatus Latescibacterota bacterium]|nr:MAG: T9SS type A sorting domain-containing protein [Candidatus Latescibacterota bacterium]
MKRACLLAVTLLLSSTLVGASQLTYEFTMPEGAFQILEKDGFDLIVLRNSFPEGPPGSPRIPSYCLSFVVPQGSRVTRTTLRDAEWCEIEGVFVLYPAQPPRPLSGQEAVFVPPHRDAYASTGPVPDTPVAHLRSGNAGGFRVAGFRVTPFRYHPAKGKLEYLRRATLVVDYVVTRGSPNTRTPFQLKEMSKALRQFVKNPHEIAKCAPPPRAPAHAAPSLDAGDFVHVIITGETLVPFVEPLREWRTQHGFPSKIMTVSEVVLQYPGWDAAEQVRNFIIDANANWGTMYVTLAGDLGVVPERNISQSDTLSGFYMPVDLYFSDLDGTWDSNDNHIYGEPGLDTLDMYSDVFVGRAPIETPAEATNFVHKVLTYEKNPPAGYIENCLLPAVELWANYHGDIVNDSIADCTPPPWNDVKQYQSQGTISRAGVIAEINGGVGYCHYAAHGNQNGVYFANSDTVMYSTDAKALVNGDALGVHNSIACISGAFDAGDVDGDCFAEHLMNNANGGAVAVIMNSRVGLGTPPDVGPSEMLSLEFYRKVFRENLFRIGAAHGISKDVYVPLGDQYWYYDFCILELILFGDAALAMWTAEPATQVVSHPENVPIGPSDFTVTVETEGQAPIENALVCVMGSSGTIYDHGSTDVSGQITFQIDVAGSDTLQVTSTALNYLPYEGTAYTSVGTGIAGDGAKGLVPNFAILPNPVTDGTTFVFSLRSRATVEIRIYDVSGREIKRVVNRTFEDGPHSAPWDGTNTYGEKVASGVYFVKFAAADQSVTQKMVLIR